jgi:hypothetical protein
MESSDENENLPSSHPAVVAALRQGRQQGRNNKRGGWQGEEMELQHKQQQDRSNGVQAAAVDLNQFRNDEVGVGYQAKHVIRQPTAIHNDIVNSRTTSLMNNNNRNKNLPTDDGSPSDRPKNLDKEEFLRNDGMRIFRKEIESILSSPS